MKWRVLCADGIGTVLCDTERQAILAAHTLDLEDCGPHSVVPDDPACAASTCTACRDGKPGTCAAPPYPGPVRR